MMRFGPMPPSVARTVARSMADFERAAAFNHD